MVSGREGHASLTGWNSLRILLLRETKKRQLTVTIVYLGGLGENKTHLGRPGVDTYRVGKNITQNYLVFKPAGNATLSS